MKPPTLICPESQTYARFMSVVLGVTRVQGVGIDGALLGPCAVLLRDTTSERYALIKTDEATARAVAAGLMEADSAVAATPHDLAAKVIALHPGLVPQRVVFAKTDGSGDGYIELKSNDGAVRIKCRVVDGIALAIRLNVPIEVDSSAWKPGARTRLYQIHHSQDVTFDTAPPIVAEPRPAADSVVEWIRDHVTPLTTCKPGGGTDDLRQIDRLVKDARVIGVGEATHATKEFMEMRHRLIEYLVSEHGFTLVGFECPFAESLDIDRFVRTGSGDADSATRATMFNNYFAIEMRNLIEWMRQFNASANNSPLGFYGVDMQFLQGPIDLVSSYFEGVDPEYLEHAHRDRASLQSVVDRLVVEKDRYIEQSSESAWRWAHFTAKIGAQAQQEQGEDEEVSLFRDACMAENVKSLLDLNGPSSKIIVCAHNRHISREPGPDGGGLMGWHLAQMFGSAYVNIALLFNEGCFRSEVNGLEREFAVGPAPDGTLENAFARADLGLALLDLGEVEDGTPASEWMAARPPMRCIGYGYSSEDEMNQFTSLDPRDLHDALIYVTTSSSPQPLGSQS